MEANIEDVLLRSFEFKTQVLMILRAIEIKLKNRFPIAMIICTMKNLILMKVKINMLMKMIKSQKHSKNDTLIFKYRMLNLIKAY